MEENKGVEPHNREEKKKAENMIIINPLSALLEEIGYLRAENHFLKLNSNLKSSKGFTSHKSESFQFKAYFTEEALERGTFEIIGKGLEIRKNIKMEAVKNIPEDWENYFLDILDVNISSVLIPGSEVERCSSFTYAIGLALIKMDYYLFSKVFFPSDSNDKLIKVVVFAWSNSSVDVNQPMSRADVNNLVSKRKFGDEKGQMSDADLIPLQLDYVKKLIQYNNIAITVDDEEDKNSK